MSLLGQEQIKKEFQIPYLVYFLIFYSQCHAWHDVGMRQTFVDKYMSFDIRDTTPKYSAREYLLPSWINKLHELMNSWW